MKKKWPILLLAVLTLAMFFLPAVTLHVHAQLGEETAAAFPSSLSLWVMMTKGSKCLPLDLVPQMGYLSFGSGLLLAGCILLILGCIASLIEKRGCAQASIALTACAAACFGTEALHISNLASSLMYTVLFTASAPLFLPLVFTAAMLILEVVFLKGGKVLLQDDRTLRLISGVLAAISACAIPARRSRTAANRPTAFIIVLLIQSRPPSYSLCPASK